MTTLLREIEGTWEEILSHASDLAGHRLRVTVLPTPESASDQPPLSPKNRRMLETLRQWRNTPLTEEETALLDEMQQYNREHPLALRQVEEE